MGAFIFSRFIQNQYMLWLACQWLINICVYHCLHTWDGVQRSAVIVVGQKCHCLCLGPLRLSNMTQTQSHFFENSYNSFKEKKVKWNCYRNTSVVRLWPIRKPYQWKTCSWYLFTTLRTLNFEIFMVLQPYKKIAWKVWKSEKYDSNNKVYNISTNVTINSHHIYNVL